MGSQSEDLPSNFAFGRARGQDGRMKRMFDRNHISSLFAALAACVALACPAAGQSRLDSLQQVEEVVVTGHVVRKEVIPVPGALGRAAPQALVAQRGRRPALLLRNPDQGLRRGRRTEDGQYPEHGHEPRRGLLRRHRAGERPERNGRSGALLARQHGGRDALQRAEERRVPAAKDFGSSGSIYLQTRTPVSTRGRPTT